MNSPDTQHLSTTGPLDGVTVVALEQAVAAPLCTARLRHAGARVIKIERSSGDFARGYDQICQGESTYFTWINQGKESLVLDIKQLDDQQLLHRLLSNADVFVQNLAPGAVEKIGFGSQALHKTFPQLITCDISGYGDNESVNHLKAYDLLVQAETGLISISGGPGEPGRIGISLCDIGAGVNAHAAVLEALIQRGKSGRGTAIKLSLFDVAAEWMTVPYMQAQFGAGAPQREGLRHPMISPYGAYRTADKVDTLVSIQNEREWLKFCKHVLGNTDLATDDRFKDNAARLKNRTELDTLILNATSQWSAKEFRSRLIQGGIAYGGLNSVDDLKNHPALKFRSVKTSTGLAFSVPTHPFSTLDTSDWRTPTIGEHSESIRREFSNAGE